VGVRVRVLCVRACFVLVWVYCPLTNPKSLSNETRKAGCFSDQVLVLLFGFCGVSGALSLSVVLGVCLFLGLLEAYEEHESR